MSDAPVGYGYTPAEHCRTVARFVDRLGLRNLTVMGQDWGGPIGLGFAGRWPELVTRFVLGNTFAWPLDDVTRVRLFSAVMGGPVGRAGTWLFNLSPRFFIARGFARPLPPAVKTAYMARWQDRRRRGPAAIAPHELIHAREFLREVEAALPRLADRPSMLLTDDLQIR